MTISPDSNNTAAAAAAVPGRTGTAMHQYVCGQVQHKKEPRAEVEADADVFVSHSDSKLLCTSNTAPRAHEGQMHRVHYDCCASISYLVLR